MFGHYLQVVDVGQMTIFVLGTTIVVQIFQDKHFAFGRSGITSGLVPRIPVAVHELDGFQLTLTRRRVDRRHGDPDAVFVAVLEACHLPSGRGHCTGHLVQAATLAVGEPEAIEVAVERGHHTHRVIRGVPVGVSVPQRLETTVRGGRQHRLLRPHHMAHFPAKAHAVHVTIASGCGHRFLVRRAIAQHQELEDDQVATACRRLRNPRVYLAALRYREHQTVQVALSGGFDARGLVPWTIAHLQIAQHNDVSGASRGRGRLHAPQHALSARQSDALQVAVLGGRRTHCVRFQVRVERRIRRVDATLLDLVVRDVFGNCVVPLPVVGRARYVRQPGEALHHAVRRHR